MIAIDFGTSRTKVAYMDSKRKEARLYRMGRGESPAIPSLFYLGADGERLVGDDAYDKLDSDPSRVVRVLKRRLRDKMVRAGGQRAEPAELLTLLFREVRTRAAEEVPAFLGFAPNAVALTIPAAGAGAGPAVENLMRSCAEAAGFEDVTILTEPEAAALGWRKDEGQHVDAAAVVVLDCGGGTVDWACLQRVGDRYRMLAECPAGGDERVGGEHLDEDLFALVRERVAANAGALGDLDERAALHMSRIRRARERFCQGGARAGARVDTLTIGTERLELSPDDLRLAFERGFIAQVCQGFGRYLDDVRRVTGVAVPRVLLVGGSFQTTGLREALRERCNCAPTHWDASEYAPVRGAVWALDGLSASAYMPAVTAAASVALPARGSVATKPGGAPQPAKPPDPLPVEFAGQRWYVLSDGITSPVLTSQQVVERVASTTDPAALMFNLVGATQWATLATWPAGWPDLRPYLPSHPLPPAMVGRSTAVDGATEQPQPQREATRPVAAVRDDDVDAFIHKFRFGTPAVAPKPSSAPSGAGPAVPPPPSGPAPVAPEFQVAALRSGRSPTPAVPLPPTVLARAVIVGPGMPQGTTLPLISAAAIVGRNRDCDIVLPDGSVSKRHAALKIAHGRVTVEDLGSTNGTYVNGQRIQSVTVVNADDVVACGDFDVRVAVAPG